jgi:hypothetical protein
VTSVLEHPGQSVFVLLMVLGVVGIHAAVFLLWWPDPTAVRPEWWLWLLLGASVAVTLVGTALL